MNIIFKNHYLGVTFLSRHFFFKIGHQVAKECETSVQVKYG